jgi:hypothetical protein
MSLVILNASPKLLPTYCKRMFIVSQLIENKYN